MNIDVDPILVDVNVHPTKMDVKFSKMDTLKNLIEEAITTKLKELLLIPNAIVRDDTVYEEVIKNDATKEENVKDITYQETMLTFDVEEETTKYEKEKPIDTVQLQTNNIIEDKYVYKTYIVAENEDGMYLIDQHAAAERVNYEKCLKKILNPTIETIPLLIPISIELPRNEYIVVKNHLDLLESIGIKCEEFGENTFIVRSHPTWLHENVEKQDIVNIFELIALNESFD